jgi:hypothetical protein
VIFVFNSHSKYRQWWFMEPAVCGDMISPIPSAATSPSSSSSLPPVPFNHFPSPHGLIPVPDLTLLSPQKQSEYTIKKRNLNMRRRINNYMRQQTRGGKKKGT